MKDSTLYGSTYMELQKWQHRRDRKQITGCLGMGIGTGCVLMADGHEATFQDGGTLSLLHCGVLTRLYTAPKSIKVNPDVIMDEFYCTQIIPP